MSSPKTGKNYKVCISSLTDISGSPDRSGKVLHNFCSVIHIELGSFFGTHFWHDQLLVELLSPRRTSWHRLTARDRLEPVGKMFSANWHFLRVTTFTTLCSNKFPTYVVRHHFYTNYVIWKVVPVVWFQCCCYWPEILLWLGWLYDNGCRWKGWLASLAAAMKLSN